MQGVACGALCTVFEVASRLGNHLERKEAGVEAGIPTECWAGLQGHMGVGVWLFEEE